MAQLVDGLPTATVARRTRGSELGIGHPIYHHEQICDAAIHKTKEFRDNFDPLMLCFDDLVIENFRKAVPGTRIFHLRLIEMMAKAVHRIAAHLFETQPKMHSGDIASVVSWQAEPVKVEVSPGRWHVWESKYPPHPTLFFHLGYMNRDQYPSDVADVAGYWAEDNIFGGVVLFKHEGDEDQIRDVFLHTGRQGDDETVRVWKLTDGQLAELIQFLTSDSLDNSNIPNCPLPLRATRTNYRVDDWDAMAIHRIFRDPWERKIPEEKDESNIRLNTGDHPELENMFDLINSAPSYDISLGSNYNTLSRGVAVEGPCSSHGSLGSAQGAHETERPSMTAPEQPDSSIPKGKLGPPWEGYDDLDYFDF